MSTTARKTPGSERKARSALRERLEARRAEIEAETLTRVNAIADSSAASDPAYVEGLRGAVAAALDYGVATIDSSEERGPPLPVALLAQARVAARSGVSLDTVLRRYFAGYSLLGYCIIEEASGLMSGAELQRLLGSQAVNFDRLLAAIGEEHTRETELLITSSDQRRAKRIESLLAGELVDTTEIAYDFEGWHLGVVASGHLAVDSVRGLGLALNLRMLVVERAAEGVVWAWFGARRKPDPLDASRLAAAGLAEGASLAFGEPATELSGWRLTHRQAASALPIAVRSLKRCVHYADVALLSAIVRDDLSTRVLRDKYLTPLDAGSDGGVVLRQTLRAYFEGGRAVSSAAAAMGVKRHTVTKRLRSIEEIVGRSIDSCAAEIDMALRLEELGE